MSTALVDVLLVSAWASLAVLDLRAASRERAARRALGPAIVGGRQPPAPLLVLLVAATLAGLVLIERREGHLPPPPAAAIAGLALTAAGLFLHVRARRTLGASWSGVVTVRAAQTVVERGPYAVVRHPIYASLLLLAGGSILAHPSVGTACLTVGFALGIGLKIVIEERALRRALGPAYASYAARVPALIPRLRKRTVAVAAGRGTKCPTG